MSVVYLFSDAASQEAGREKLPCEDTVLVMFSESEHLSLGLLMNRKMPGGEDVFKDVQLQTNRHAASLALRFSADQAPYMHIDKIRNVKGNGHIYKLRQENESEIVRDNLWDIYDIARDRISVMLGEPLYEQTPECVQKSTPHLHLVSS